MTLYKGAILLLESQPTGLQRKFKVLELSLPHDESKDGEETDYQTQLVRLQILE